MKSTLRHYLTGVRTYIALGTLLVTAETAWWSIASYGHTRTALIRTQEVYAWLALILLIVALSIGPFLKIFPGVSAVVKQLLRDSRRLVGVSAAWFASLHAALTYVYLFNVANPLKLAQTYQVSFTLGVTALIILLLMAFTSFNKAFMTMGIWWFRLHRLVYIAILVALVHAFMIGAHAVELYVLVSLLLVGLLLTAAYAYLYFVKAAPTKSQLITLVYLVVLLGAVLNYGLTQHLSYNYFTHHHTEAAQVGHH